VGELIQNPGDATGGLGFVDLIGREIGRYHIQKRLGRGGLTTVYQAYDMVDDFPVALKVLLHRADEKVYNRFRYEAQTAAKLQHPHIVRTLRVGVATGSDTAYIAMELVEGEDLSALLATRRRLAAEESAVLLAPIAQALAYAHKRGVIHRDVKPSNILLRTVGAGTPHSIVLDSLDYPLVPLLSDFGIARALDVPELTHSGRTVGTPAFMAPEQCLGRRNIDHRADLYALGAVFYRCITGRQPFVGSTVQVLHAHVYNPVTIEEEVLRQLSQYHIQLLQRSLAKDPDDRYQSADEMAADFALGANSSDLLMTTEQLEQNTTVTLNLVAIEKAAPPSGQTAILIPSAGEPAQPAGNPTTETRATTPDIYYDRVLDQRLRKLSGIVLLILMVLIGAFMVFSWMDISTSDLWQWIRSFGQPLQSTVLANDEDNLAAGDSCIPPDSVFEPYIAQVDQTARADFACATGAVVQGDGELLKLERGYMLYLYATDKMFVVRNFDQQWVEIDLMWLDGDTIPPPAEISAPEEGRFTPKQMFGKIWQNAEIRKMLGTAIMPNAVRFPVLAQKFPGGWLIVNRDRADELFLLLRDDRLW